MNNGDKPASPMPDMGFYRDISGKEAAKLHKEFGGMTKREAFAKAAMQGVLASDNEGCVSTADCVRIAVNHADALLDELEK